MAKTEDEQDQRIEDLKREAEKLSEGDMEVRELDDCPSEIEETFWKQVVEYEAAPWTTHFHQLEVAGVSLPPPDTLGDQELTKKLWEVIHVLALLHVFLEQTDHLSDRELYSHLWGDCLLEEIKALPPVANSAWHIPMLGGCSEEDNALYFKYYADESSRQHWQEEFPRDLLPPHEDLPFDRDRSLPKPDHHSLASSGTN